MFTIVRIENIAFDARYKTGDATIAKRLIHSSRDCFSPFQPFNFEFIKIIEFAKYKSKWFLLWFTDDDCKHKWGCSLLAELNK